MNEKGILAAAMTRRDRLRKEIIEIENWIRLYHQFAREVNWSMETTDGKGARPARRGERQIVPAREDVAIGIVDNATAKTTDADATRSDADKIADLTDGRDSIV